MGLTDAILLAAGTGSRYSQSLPKQFHLLEEKPVFVWSLLHLAKSVPLRKIWLVVSQEHMALTRALLEKFSPKEVLGKTQLVLGGPQRQDSSLNALQAIQRIDPHPHSVLIHDACRPYISSSLAKGIREHIGLKDKKGWIPVIPVTETLKKVEHNLVKETINRLGIFRVQTPQIFCFSTLIDCFLLAKNTPEISFTDDASVLELFGKEVGTFPGDERNIKLTYEKDSEFIKPHLVELKGELPCVSAAVMTSIV